MTLTAMSKPTSFRERFDAFKHLRIEHDALVEAKDRISQTIDFGPYTTDAPCTVISGPSGVGKTTLFRWLRETYQFEPGPRITIELPRRPPFTVIPRKFIWVTLPEIPTVESLCTSILHLYGDPHFEEGDWRSKTRRIDIIAHHSGTIAWFVDETQRLVDRDGVVTSDRIVNWLRARSSNAGRNDLGLEDAKHIALFLFGLGRTEHVLTQDDQIERRFDAGIRIEAFATEGKSWERFQDVLTTFHAHCPLPFAEDIKLDATGVTKSKILDEIDVNFLRFHYATWGLTGRLARLFEQAILIAMRPSGGKVISLEVLERAFDELIMVNRHKIAIRKGNVTELRDMPNPFSADFDATLPPPPMPADRELLPDTKTRRKRKDELKRQAQVAFIG